MRFVDLFAGLGGFHAALRELGHECVFACESDPELRELYRLNYPDLSTVHGDIRVSKQNVPPHDILCAGFPCQPFSKSGFQNGLNDKTRGTLFHEIVKLLRLHQPPFVILENVGNFARHDNGRTWRIVRDSLTKLGYTVRATEHVATNGHGLISPHHLGYPHTRERFFVVASSGALPSDPFPPRDRRRKTNLSELVQLSTELTDQDKREVRLSADQIACIEHWNALIRNIPDEYPLPSFPIWGDEIKARYPFVYKTPSTCRKDTLRRYLGLNGNHHGLTKQQLLARFPSYARSNSPTFPHWKQRYVRANRHWFRAIEPFFPNDWVRTLRTFVPSHRKLEWNCQGEERDLWQCVLQFRPSGLRAKRYIAAPSLVSMTETQIPVLGPERRFLTRTEGLRLQGLPDQFRLPRSRANAFRALGNAVHVGVALAVAEGLLDGAATVRTAET